MLEEIVREIALEEQGVSYSVGKNGGYFFGVRSIYGFNDGEIRLLTADGVLSVRGKGLTVEKYFERDMLIKGEIIAVMREEKA